MRIPNLSLNIDQYPLYMAINKAHVETVKVLLAHGADTDLKNSEEQTPSDLAQFLIDRGVADAGTQANWKRIKEMLTK